MKIGERGQVTIPQKFRQRFGLKSKAQVEFVEIDGQLVLRKAPVSRKKAWAKSYGILGGNGLRTDDLMKELRDR
jgi:AbrB family looped-hinge helix DNA binding protein